MSEQLIQTPCAVGENGNFLLERELGSGGMGGVYMGRDKMLDRPVAVKVMLKELGADAEFVEKFKKEAQSAARLIHPNIAQIYSYGICDGMPYIAMELASGGSLYSMMNANKGKTDVARVIKICQQVAQALQCASDQGCVHGDVKPENILLDANGNAKLVDFGLAAMQKDTDEIWGTPYYIAPEKVKKEPIDFRADMYSLGGTLYHALTGVAPFEGEDSIAVVKKRFAGMPRKPSEVRSDLTPAIDSLVLKMLALDRANRYPSFEALIKAFKDVLTNGLTAGASGKKAASAAVRPLGMRGGRRLTPLRRPGGMTVRGKSEAAASAPPPEADDEEKEGSLGLKVVGAVVGGILLILAVVGGLVWYQVADRKAREADELAQITDHIRRARESISGTVEASKKLADEFDAFSEKAVAECQKSTDRLMACMPEDQGALLKPAPSKELLDAIASTNEALKAVSATNAAQVVAVMTNALATMATAMKDALTTGAAAALPKFPPPTEEESDPASPEGIAYRQKREAFYADLKNKMAAAAQEPKPAETPAEPAKKPEPNSEAVLAMNELWNRVYGCQASAIRIRQQINKQIIQKGEEADALTGTDRQVMDKLAEYARILTEQFEQIKSSKDAENLRKGISFIRQKGEKTVKQTIRAIEIEKIRVQREKERLEREKAEKERLERIATEKKARIEQETSDAKAKFDAIALQGCFRQLDWKSALRQLENAKAETTTAEGQLAYDFEIRKVNDMKSVQDIFLKNLQGYVFRGSKLGKHKVLSVNERELELLKPDGKTRLKVFWQKFYKDYPGNFNEIINAYIFNARNPSGRIKLSLRDWADAMTGAALTMKLVCSEVNGALERSEFLIREVVKNFEDYRKTAQEMFPDITFEETKED